MYCKFSLLVLKRPKDLSDHNILFQLNTCNCNIVIDTLLLIEQGRKRPLDPKENDREKRERRKGRERKVEGEI